MIRSKRLLFLADAAVLGGVLCLITAPALFGGPFAEFKDDAMEPEATGHVSRSVPWTTLTPARRVERSTESSPTNVPELPPLSPTR